jgi:hypothetical protein
MLIPIGVPVAMLRDDATGRLGPSFMFLSLAGRRRLPRPAKQRSDAEQLLLLIGQLGSMSRSGARSGHSTSQAQTGLPLAGSSCQRHSRTGRRRRSAALRRSDWRIFEDHERKRGFYFCCFCAISASTGFQMFCCWCTNAVVSAGVIRTCSRACARPFLIFPRGVSKGWSALVPAGDGPVFMNR